MKVKEKKKDIKDMLRIAPDHKPVILIGRGPSVDDLDLEALNHQGQYHTCTISDAIKLLDKPTYSFQYHWRGIMRCQNELDKPHFLLMPFKIERELTQKGYEKVFNIIKELDNVYYFNPNHVGWDVIAKGEFIKDFKEPRLQNHEGSVVGAVHFLCGYMGVTKIRYVGFDGGEQPGVASYGKLVHAGRKGPKIVGASKDYAKSWEAVNKMLEYYPEVSFKPLKEYLKK